MSAISREEVAHVARLARLRLEDAEADALTEQLAKVLDYVAQLDQVDSEGVPPTAGILSLATPMRPDEARPSLAPEAAVQNAPHPMGTAFGVPKVLDDEAEG